MTHTRAADGTVTMDQDEYIAAFKPISPKYYQHLKAKDECPERLKDLKALYWSLVGAVAYVSMTQAWVLVYIVALQRKTHSPQVVHVKRLNNLCKELQRRP